MNYLKLSFLLIFLTLLGSVLDSNLLIDHQEEPMDLIQVSSDVKEYTNYQLMKLFFSSNEVNPKLLQDMQISNNSGELFNIKLNNCTKLKNNSLGCIGDFRKIKADKYKINKINYDNKDILVKKDIFLEVHKKGEPVEDLKLLEIKGDTYRDEKNIVTLIFNKNIKQNYFTTFYLVNKFNDTFEIPFEVIKEDNTSLMINLNLDLIIEDKYFMYFKYEGKIYYNNNERYINVIDENKNYDFNLTKVLSFLEGGKKDQKCYLFFDTLYPKTLHSLSFCDYNFNKIEIEADCSSDYYDEKKDEEKCLLDLTNVKKGNYYICEYYWKNNQNPLRVKTKKYYKVIVE